MTKNIVFIMSPVAKRIGRTTVRVIIAPMVPSNKRRGIGGIVEEIIELSSIKLGSTKQSIEPESISPKEEIFGKVGKVIGTFSEFGLESAAALSRTSRTSPMELPQPSDGGECRGPLSLFPVPKRSREQAL